MIFNGIYSHIYSSAAVTYDVSKGFATLADAREFVAVITGSNTVKQATMDLHNNELGREIGSQVITREEIPRTVYEAIRANRHIRITPPQNVGDIKNEAENKQQSSNVDTHPKTGAYIGRSKSDSKVRSEHALQDGEIYNWEYPPEGGHPGEAYGCRCTAEPYVSSNEEMQLQELFS